MTSNLSRMLLCLGLAWATPAAAAGPDCEAPGNWAQKAVCQSRALGETQAQLDALAADARARSQDQDAFDAEQQAWAAERRDACTTVRCLQTSYRSRMDELRLQVAGGRPPLLTPGTYHRHDAATADDGAGWALWIEVADRDRYRLRVLSSEDGVRPVEGEFNERVGSARFTAPGCAFDLAFAPDVIALSGAAGELCDAGLEGSYVLTAPQAGDASDSR